MQTQLLAIDLLPDFAILAALVIIGHWVWLFVLKNRSRPVTAPLKVYREGAEASPAAQPFTSSPQENPITSSCITDLYAATEALPGVESVPPPSVASPPDRETILLNKYAEADMVSLLEALQMGSLTPESEKELQELACLTLSTEERYPDPIDLDAMYAGLPEEHES
jgi:hypothetical protein